MKKILIAATIVGAAAASMILYSRSRTVANNKIENAAEDANNVMDKQKHLRKLLRKTKQAMS